MGNAGKQSQEADVSEAWHIPPISAREDRHPLQFGGLESVSGNSKHRHSFKMPGKEQREGALIEYRHTQPGTGRRESAEKERGFHSVTSWR